MAFYGLLFGSIAQKSWCALLSTVHTKDATATTEGSREAPEEYSWTCDGAKCSAVLGCSDNYSRVYAVMVAQRAQCTAVQDGRGCHSIT